jgi:hypothetical protein
MENETNDLQNLTGSQLLEKFWTKGDFFSYNFQKNFLETTSQG